MMTSVPQRLRREPRGAAGCGGERHAGVRVRDALERAGLNRNPNRARLNRNPNRVGEGGRGKDAVKMKPTAGSAHQLRLLSRS